MTADVRDLGYQRGSGLRRPARVRWRVIARQFVADAWRPWWRFRAWLGCAIAITGAGVTLLCLPMSMSNDVFRVVNAFGSDNVLLAMSIEWYCRVALMASLALGVASIAGDAQTGAFTFYFSRAVRPRDYVLGKLAGNLALVAALVVPGPIVLALLRLGLYDSASEILDHADLLVRALAAGLTVAIPYAVIPLGFSALATHKRTALALWAAYYLVLGTFAALTARTHGGSLGAIDLPTACLSLAFRLFGAQTAHGRRAARGMATSAAVIALAVQVVLALIAVWVRVSRAQKHGIGQGG